MNRTEATISSSIGEAMFVRQWTPIGSARAAAVLSHGVFEHSGRYHHVAERFVRHGYAVWALDHVGHGRSGGPRGDIQHSDHVVDDLGLLVRRVTDEIGTRPVLLGHSMGGAIAALYAVRHQVSLRALALSSPALRAHASALMISIARLIALGAPTLQAPGGLGQPATRNPEWEAQKAADSLAHHRMTLRLARFIVDAGREARRRAPELNLRVGLFVAGQDTYVDKRGALEFYERLKPGLGEYHEYPGLCHEVFNELERERTLGDLEAWLRMIDG
jgi:alpha-beta hydrolase superfamily lysophospholipase